MRGAILFPITIIWHRRYITMHIQMVHLKVHLNVQLMFLRWERVKWDGKLRCLCLNKLYWGLESCTRECSCSSSMESLGFPASSVLDGLILHVFGDGQISSKIKSAKWMKVPFWYDLWSWRPELRGEK